MAAEVFGPYRLEVLLGRGGMGEVWQAVDVRKGRRVALKVLAGWLASDESFGRRFEREAAIVAGMSCPHIIPIHDYGAVDDRYFIEMPLVAGAALGELVGGVGLPPERAVRIVEQVARALDVAHGAGVLHRDVKPSNVLVADDGGADFAYLIDFGVARRVKGDETVTAGVFGSPAYMAPERFEGAGDERSDVYALGCVLFQTLAGRPPFGGDGFYPLLRAHREDPVPALDVAPRFARLDDVVARALAKDPAERYATAGELGAAARAALPRGDEHTLVHATAPAPDPAAFPGDRAHENSISDATQHWRRSAAALAGDDATASAEPGAAASPRPWLVRRRWWVGAAALLIGIGTVAALLVVPPGFETDRPHAVGPTPATVAHAVTASADGSVRTISDLGPTSIALSADGRTLWSISSPRDQPQTTLVEIDTATLRERSRHVLPFAAHSVAVPPTEPVVYLVGNGFLTVFDTSTWVVLRQMSTLGTSGWPTVSPDGSRAFVLNEEPDKISLIVEDTRTGEFVVSVPISAVASDQEISLVVSADGRDVYVGLRSGLVVVDTGTNTVVQRYPQPFDYTDPCCQIAVAPDQSVAIIGKWDSPQVSVVDLRVRAVVGRFQIEGLDLPLAMSPDGRQAYLLTGESSKLASVDVASGELVRTFEVAPSMTFLVSPDGATAYAVSDAGLSVIALKA